jgi:hypothetical protein
LCETELASGRTGRGRTIRIFWSKVALFAERNNAVTACGRKSGCEYAATRTSIRIDRIAVIALLVCIELTVATARQNQFRRARGGTTIIRFGIAIVALLALGQYVVTTLRCLFLRAATGASVVINIIPIVTFLARIEVVITTKNKTWDAGTIAEGANVTRRTASTSNFALFSWSRITVPTERPASCACTRREVAILSASA